MALATSGQIDLAIPAFALIEPYWTIENRRRVRKDLHERVNEQLSQIARSHDHSAGKGLQRDLTSLLIAAIERDMVRLEDVRRQILDRCHVIPLDSVVLVRAETAQGDFSLGAQDAVILASILVDL